MEKVRIMIVAWPAFVALWVFAGSLFAAEDGALSVLGANEAEARLFLTGGSQGITQEMINQQMINQKISNQQISNQQISNQQISNQQISNQQISNERCVWFRSNSEDTTDSCQ